MADRNFSQLMAQMIAQTRASLPQVTGRGGGRGGGMPVEGRSTQKAATVNLGLGQPGAIERWAKFIPGLQEWLVSNDPEEIKARGRVRAMSHTLKMKMEGKDVADRLYVWGPTNQKELEKIKNYSPELIKVEPDGSLALIEQPMNEIQAEMVHIGGLIKEDPDGKKGLLANWLRVRGTPPGETETLAGGQGEQKRQALIGAKRQIVGADTQEALQRAQIEMTNSESHLAKMRAQGLEKTMPYEVKKAEREALTADLNLRIAGLQVEREVKFGMATSEAELNLKQQQLNESKAREASFNASTNKTNQEIERLKMGVDLTPQQEVNARMAHSQFMDFFYRNTATFADLVSEKMAGGGARRQEMEKELHYAQMTLEQLKQISDAGTGPQQASVVNSLVSRLYEEVQLRVDPTRKAVKPELYNEWQRSFEGGTSKKVLNARNERILFYQYVRDVVDTYRRHPRADIALPKLVAITQSLGMSVEYESLTGKQWPKAQEEKPKEIVTPPATREEISTDVMDILETQGD